MGKKWTKISVIVKRKDDPWSKMLEYTRCKICGQAINKEWECKKCGIYYAFEVEKIK